MKKPEKESLTVELNAVLVIELQQRFESTKIYKAFNEGYCGLLLGTGDV